MAKKGRPSLYTQDLADRICERLAAGETLRAVCRDEGMPDESTVRDWALSKEEFSPQYARAREIGYATMFEQMLEIADTPVQGVTITTKLSKEGSMYDETKRGDMLEHRRLQVDTRKWMLSKALPKIYGDKQQHEHSGTINHTINETLAAGRERARLARAAG